MKSAKCQISRSEKWKCFHPALEEHRKQQCGEVTPEWSSISAWFGFSFLTWRKCLLTEVFQVAKDQFAPSISVLRKFVRNEILVHNLSPCLPQRNQPWLWFLGTWLDPARSSAPVLSEVPSACSGSSKKCSEIPVHFTQATNQLSNLNDFPSLLHVGCIWISELEVKGSKNVITSPLRHLAFQG